jgi:hypothetical protein
MKYRTQINYLKWFFRHAKSKYNPMIVDKVDFKIGNHATPTREEKRKRSQPHKEIYTKKYPNKRSYLRSLDYFMEVKA